MGDHQKVGSHWKSEYNMGQFYFERYNEIQQELDRLGYFVGQYNQQSLPYLRPYLSALRVFFNNLQAAMEKPAREEFIDLFDQAELAIIESLRKSTGSKVYVKGHRKLIRLHGYLLKIMQDMGLGLILSRKRSTKSKLKELLRGKTE